MVKATQILTVAVVAMTAVLTAESSLEAQDLSVTVRLRNDARVREDQVQDARHAVTYIYEKAGVRLSWVERNSTITVILLTAEQASKLHQAEHTMGFAPGSETVRSTVAYILMHRVDEVSAGYHTDKNVVLGAAVAHELGHLLLPINAHSKTGLMRSVWNQADFRNARSGELLFTSDQAAQIHQSPVFNRQSARD